MTWPRMTCERSGHMAASLYTSSRTARPFSLSFSTGSGRRGIYLLDEPEAALSPERQLAFLRLIWQMVQRGESQFLIATHSPILLAFPEAEIYNLDFSPLKPVQYEDTGHYRLTHDFLNNREQYLRHLFVD